MSITQIPNFLSKEDFDLLNFHIITNKSFPWIFQSTNAYDHENDKEQFHFSHIFYREDVEESDQIHLIRPILSKLTMTPIIRCNMVLRPYSQQIIKSKFHTDYKNCKTAIYYLNTCDGYTEFITGEKIISEANTMVVFDSNIAHLGTSTTNAQCRIVLNINYK